MTDINKVLRHQLQLARLERQGFNSFIAPSLGETLREIRRILADVDTITNRRQLRALETAITAAIQNQTGWAALTDELTDLAIYENTFYARLIGAAAAQDEMVQRLASRTMMVLRSGERYNTGLFPDFIRDNLGSQASAVNNIVRTGYANGLTGRQMRGQISNLFDGLLTRHAQTLAQTGYAHYASVGRRAFAEANKDVVVREIPVVTFDSRVSDTCVSISARYGEKGWPVGESPIGFPPYHMNCRTTVVPTTEAGLTGTRSSSGDQAGQIPAKTPVDKFVRDQSPEFQNELLGPERAQLFREGKLSLRNLTDPQLKPLSLDELRGLGG